MEISICFLLNKEEILRHNESENETITIEKDLNKELCSICRRYIIVNGKSPEQTQETEKKSKKIIIAGILVIIALFAVIVVLLMKGKEEEPKRNVVVTKENAEEVLDDMMNQDYIEPGYYSASMSTTWHFATGDAVSEDAYVENVPENTNDVYFDLVLAENEEEVLLKSPVIPRGSELNDIALDKSLSAGTYDCVLIYHLVDEEQNTVSTLRVGVTVIVEG